MHLNNLNLNKSYGRKPVLKELSLGLNPGELLGLVGVNGSGKTTTIAKLANLFLEQDYGVMLAAGDTFRAAAVEQLTVWGERHGIAVVGHFFEEYRALGTTLIHVIGVADLECLCIVQPVDLIIAGISRRRLSPAT